MSFDKEELRDVVNEVLDSRDRLDRETHMRHHQFIEELMEDFRRKKERAEAIKRHVMGWGAVLLVASFITSLGDYVLKIIERAAK